VRDIDGLATAEPVACKQRSHSANKTEQPGGDRGLVGWPSQRLALGIPIQMRVATSGVVGQITAVPAGVGAGTSKGTQLDSDEVIAIDLMRTQRTRSRAFNDHIDLAPIDVGLRCCGCVAMQVALLMISDRRLANNQYVGAMVGKGLRAVGPGNGSREFNDEQIVQRSHRD